MTSEQLATFDALRTQWLRHHDLRRTGAPIAALSSSRLELDRARQQAASARR